MADKLDLILQELSTLKNDVNCLKENMVTTSHLQKIESKLDVITKQVAINTEQETKLKTLSAEQLDLKTDIRLIKSILTNQ
ncbi:hypothetical protein [Bacillus cereus]|uniref:Uncharacterized protein n=1 Tax=Bacillus cereus VD184 TaxID=1053242 RepID=A0A9W5VUV8_BACCE|nr:hypothetical protein [Bacillus cereus]EOQ18626.1 hypothetical protein IKC_05127 [Bacillus cereus VD184]